METGISWLLLVYFIEGDQRFFISIWQLCSFANGEMMETCLQLTFSKPSHALEWLIRALRIRLK